VVNHGDTLKCQACGAEIPDVSRFCLSCGKEVPPPKSVPAEERKPAVPDPDPNGHAMICFALSFMMFFMTLVPIFLGLWAGAGILAGIGVFLVLVGCLILRSGRRQAEEIRESALVKVKCRYCGSLNAPDALRCCSCGATL